MQKLSKFTALAAAGLMVAAPLAGALPALAASTTTTAASSSAVPAGRAQEKALIKTSNNAFDALRAVRGARLAIFNGDIKQATKMTETALTDMQKAKTEDAKLAVTVDKKASTADQYVPVDATIGLSDGFVPTPDKVAQIKKANAHMAKGETSEAAEVLQLANIDVVVSAALVPTQSSVTNLDHAATLMKDGKYYQANLALKAVEDGVVFHSYGLNALPAQS